MSTTGEALLLRAAVVDEALGGPFPFTMMPHNQQPIMSDDELERRLSLDRVADLTSYSITRIRELIRSGDLPAVRWGRSYRVKESDLKKFMADRERLEIPERQRPGTSMDEARRARDGDGGEA